MCPLWALHMLGAASYTILALSVDTMLVGNGQYSCGEGHGRFELVAAQKQIQ